MAVLSAARIRRATLALTAALAILMAGVALPGSSDGRGASAAAATTAPYCGATLSKATGGNWTCTFADDFSGTSLNTAKWSPVTTAETGLGAPGCMVNSLKNLSVSSGTLRLTARKESRPLTCSSPNGSFSTPYTSGGVMSTGKFAQAHGRFEIRAKFPAVKVAGVHSALWLWPQDIGKYGTNSGEIDIAEFYTKHPDRVIPFLHYQQAEADPSVTNNYCMMDRPEDFHIYLLEWTTRSIKISYDGKTCIEHSIKAAAPLSGAAPFDTPFFVNLTQMLGQAQNAFSSTTTPLPATMQVDYVRVWS